jgi:oligoribonuclease NrnB/cAMP/cGMP phosphodiesterase (DHH superfamily)
MVHVFYHRSDSDGKASGAIIKKHLLDEKQDFVMHPYEYGEKFPDDIPVGDELIFADIVVSPYEEMAKVIDKYSPRITVVDHHKSFIEWLEKDQHCVLMGRLDTTKSACYLCWEHFFPELSVPQIIKLLSDYDIWNKDDKVKWEKIILPFQSGIKAMDIDPITNWNLWQALFVFNPENEITWINDTIDNGKAILDYQTIINAGVIRSNAFEASFDGLKAICCNTNSRNSQTFISAWDENKYDLMIAFDIDKDGKYKVSLYTTRKDIDLSEIARKHMGGGHSQAAGFTSSNMIRKENEILFT